MLSLSGIKAQITNLEAVGAANADPDAWTEMLAAYYTLLAEIKAASDPSGPGGAKWTVSEIVSGLPEFADLTTRVMALVSEFLPKSTPATDTVD